MNFKKTAQSASLLLAITYCSTGVAEGLPEACFESGLDHLIFVNFGFDANPKLAGSSFTYDAEKKYGGAVVRKRLEEGLGPARRKPIVINLQEKNNSSRGQVHLDASGSTSPSGKIDFVWVNAGTNARLGYSATLDVDHWSMDTVRLRVIDPICRFEAEKTVEVPKR